MTERVRTQEWCGGYSRAISSYPLGKWWQLGLWRTDVGASPQHLSTLFVPHISGLKVNPGQTEEQYRWRVSLDVAHFFPSEISLRIRDGLLEVTGRHEERPDQHGFAARCFTRKYRLPAEADTAKMVSMLSADGVLTVEAPVPESSVPALTIIPIKVEMEEEKEKGDDKLPGDGRGPVHPDFPAADDEGEALHLEDHSYHGQPGSATNGLQQEEETCGEPDGESHPSVPADGKSSESLQDEGRGTDAPEQPEAEVVEGITQPELSQLDKGPQSEEDQEQEDQEQDQGQDQEQEHQEDQEQEQEQEDQEQDQGQDQEQEHQEDQDLKH